MILSNFQLGNPLENTALSLPATNPPAQGRAAAAGTAGTTEPAGLAGLAGHGGCCRTHLLGADQ